MWSLEKILFVVYMIYVRKMVMFFINIDFVKWIEYFFNLWNSCMFKDMINFCKLAFEFFSL